jgi:hypothetical protein
VAPRSKLESIGNVGPAVAESQDVRDAVAALAAQVDALLPQARGALGESRSAEIAGRIGQIRQEALRGVNQESLAENQVWLDRMVAELLGAVGGAAGS